MPLHYYSDDFSSESDNDADTANISETSSNGDRAIMEQDTDDEHELVMEGINWKDIPDSQSEPFWLNERPFQLQIGSNDMEELTAAFESTAIDFINVASTYHPNPFRGMRMLISEQSSILPFVFLPRMCRC